MAPKARKPKNDVDDDELVIIRQMTEVIRVVKKPTNAGAAKGMKNLSDNDEDEDEDDDGSDVESDRSGSDDDGVDPREERKAAAKRKVAAKKAPAKAKAVPKKAATAPRAKVDGKESKLPLAVPTDSSRIAGWSDVLKMGSKAYKEFNNIPVIKKIIATLLIYKPRSPSYEAMMDRVGEYKGRSGTKQYKKLQGCISRTRERSNKWLADSAATEGEVVMHPSLPIMFSESFACAGLFGAPGNDCKHESVMDLSTDVISVADAAQLSAYDLDHLISVALLQESYDHLLNQDEFQSRARQTILDEFFVHLLFAAVPDPDYGWPANCFFRCKKCDATNRAACGDDQTHRIITPKLMLPD